MEEAGNLGARACVVDEHVELGDALEERRSALPHALERGEVQLERRKVRLGADLGPEGLADLLHGLLRLLLRPGGDGDLAPGRGEGAGGLEADARRGPLGTEEH